MAVCREPGCIRHYGCVLRAKGIAVAPTATPTRANRVPPRKADPAWERGVAGEYRRDGSFMPYVHPNGSPIHVKEAGERRHELATQLDRLRKDPNVFAAERAAAS